MGLSRVPVITPSDCDLGWVVVAKSGPWGPEPREPKCAKIAKIILVALYCV